MPQILHPNTFQFTFLRHIMTNTLSTPQKAVMPNTWQGEFKALLWLGLPMGLAQLIQYSIYTVDTVMIGRLGPQELGAAALGTVIYFLFWMIGAGPVMAVSPLVSQALGADQNNTRDVRMSVRMSIWLIVFMTPFLFLFVLFAEPILVALGQPPALSLKASHYMMALIAGWPFALGIMALRNFLAAIDKTLIPLILIAASVLINAALNYILIFGAFGAPRLELVGAGIASSLSYALCFFMFVIYIKIDKDAKRFDMFENWWRLHWHRMKDVIQLGWPISVTTLFEGMLFNACVLLMGAIGGAELAAYQIALNVASLAFMMPFGLSMAGAVRVGLAKGAGNYPAIRRAGLVTIFASIILIMIFAIPIALFPDGVAALYLNIADEKNTAVIAIVGTFLPIAAAFMLFDATQVSSNQILRGLKDVQIPMVMTGISYWVIGFPIAFYFGLYTPVGAVGIWYGILAGLITASILLGARLWHLGWRQKV